MMNKDTFEKLIKEYQEYLYILALAILRNETDAEDAVCSAIVKGYERLSQLRDEGKFKSWMISITRNEALMMKRKQLYLPGDEAIENMLEPATDHPDELWDMIQRMPEEYRVAIVLYYYHNFSVQEIADVLEIPIGTVKSRLNRGRKYLKNDF